MTAVGSVALGAPTSLDDLQRSIVEHPSALRVEVLAGVPAKPVRLALAPTGLAILRGQTVDAYRWSEVRSVKVRRGAVVVKIEAPRERTVKKKDGTIEQKPYTEKQTSALRVAVDGVVEPHLAPLFAHVVEDMLASKFSFKGTSWLQYQNGFDRLHDEFHDQDDVVLPMAAAGLWVSIGLLAMFLVPVGVNAATVRSVPLGAFAIWDPIGAFDPRSVIAGFALAAMVATLVLRFALGRAASVWARGAARGWARPHDSPLVRFVIRQMGRLTLATSSAAVIVLLALLAFWPNAAATLIVDKDGLRNEVLLPWLSIEERWREATSITRDPGGVTIRFLDGRIVMTEGHDLGGGTPGQFLEVTNAWWKAAR